jgi:hypothetical protein
MMCPVDTKPCNLNEICAVDNDACIRFPKETDVEKCKNLLRCIFVQKKLKEESLNYKSEWNRRSKLLRECKDLEKN